MTSAEKKLVDSLCELREALVHVDGMVRRDVGRPTVRDMRAVSAVVRASATAIADALVPGGLVYEEVRDANERDARRGG